MMNKPGPYFLHPVSLKDFFSTYWEKQPLHIHRKDGFSQTLLDLATIEFLMASQPLYFPGVQLTQAGKVIDVASYADEQNRILPLRLFEQHAQGGTIILSQAQKLFAPLNEICREIMRTMNMRCQANVYLSPPGNQGFNAHYDTHDVFILQVSGAKTFNFYPSPIELPYPEDSFDAGNITSNEIDESIDLVAGDTLYIPRGVVHDAVADSSRSSLHITLGVYPVLIRDMLQEAIQCVSEQDVGFRQSTDTFSVSREELDGGVEPLTQILVSRMQEVRAWLADPDSIKLLQGRFLDQLSIDALQDCQGVSLRMSHMESADGQLPPFEIVRVRQELIINYERFPGGLKIRTFGQVVEFSDPLSGIIEKLLDAGELRREELGDLNATQTVAAIKRLLQENLVDVF
ncbi:MAG: cupin domain-containing protein [Granulosicoccus sp.]